MTRLFPHAVESARQRLPDRPWCACPAGQRGLRSDLQRAVGYVDNCGRVVLCPQRSGGGLGVGHGAIAPKHADPEGVSRQVATRRRAEPDLVGGVQRVEHAQFHRRLDFQARLVGEVDGVGPVEPTGERDARLRPQGDRRVVARGERQIPAGRHHHGRAGDRLLLEHLHAVVGLIGNVDPSRCIEVDLARVEELAWTRAEVAERGDEVPRRIEDLDAAVARVGDDHAVPSRVDGNPLWHVELTVTAASRSPLVEVGAVGAEHLDSVAEAVRDENPLSGLVESKALGPEQPAVAWARLAPFPHEAGALCRVGRGLCRADGARVRDRDVDEHFDAVVVLIEDVDLAVACHRNAVRIDELAVAGAELAPLRDETNALAGARNLDRMLGARLTHRTQRELLDARQRARVGDVDRGAVGARRGEQAVRVLELSVPTAGCPPTSDECAGMRELLDAIGVVPDKHGVGLDRDRCDGSELSVAGAGTAPGGHHGVASRGDRRTRRGGILAVPRRRAAGHCH